MSTLSLKELLNIAEKNDGYQFPQLNDKIHIQYQSLTQIPHDLITHFTELKTLYINHNAISAIPPEFQSMQTLTSLFIQANSLSTLANLPPNLRACNASENSIQSVDASVTKCPLQDLNLAQNFLRDLEGFECLFEENAEENRLVETLKILNLERNQIADERIMELVPLLKNLKYLKLQGNPFIRKVKNYRMVLICALPNLTFLDEHPVTEEDRRLALAWQRGGMDEMKREKQLMADERKRKADENHKFMEDLMNEALREKEEKERAGQ